MKNHYQENDEFPEPRSGAVYAKSMKAAIANKLLHFPRSELLEVRVLEAPKDSKLGKYFVAVSEDLD